MLGLLESEKQSMSNQIEKNSLNVQCSGVATGHDYAKQIVLLKLVLIGFSCIAIGRMGVHIIKG